MYLTIFYFCVVLNLVIFLIIINVAIHHSRKKYTVINFPLKIVRAIIPLTSKTFFLPIFFVLMSAFDCTKKNTNLYTDELKCGSLIYYINCGIAFVSLLLFISVNLVAVSIFYEYSLGETNNILSKTTSKPDVFFAMTKIFVTVIFVALDGDEDIHYILIITCNLFTFISMCLNFYYPRFNEVILIFMNQFLSFTLWWASFILLIGKLTRNSDFDACMGIFFVTEPIFCFIILLKSNKNIHYSINNVSTLVTSPSELLQEIKTLIYLIDHKDYDRNCYVTLKGYITLFEERCTLKDCPLKKYNNSIKYGNDGKAFLFQHIELLFSICLSKFPNSIEARFSYALFLLQKMNKRKHANELLKDIEELNLSLEEEFTIFRCKKLIEDELTDLIGENSGNLDIVRELEYKNLNMRFKNSIVNASNLYIDFWSQLLSSHSSGSEDLTKLNECGTKINKEVKEINDIFEKMQKIKNNDYDAIKIYSDFINDILNDKGKGLKYKLMLNELGDIIDVPSSNEFDSNSLNTLNLNDKYQYIIASGNEDNFGIITNISLSVTQIFGFEYGELIGKNVDIIIPEIFHKEHKKVLKNCVNEFKRKYIEESTHNKKEPKEIITFGRNKSKYLIELNLKATLIHTENHEIYFAASISKEHVFYHTNNINTINKEQTCYIMTNNKLIIQNFSANAISYLGLNSGVINNNVEITYLIKQFYEDFLRAAVENGQLTPEQKLCLKKNILNKKFKNPVNIIWRKTEANDLKFNSSKIIDLKSSIFPKSKTIGNNYNDDYFCLTVNDLIINKKLIGYIFKFEKTHISNTNSTKCLPLSPIPQRKSFKYSNSNYKSESKESMPYPLNNNNNNNNYNITITPKSNLDIDPNYIPNSKFNFKLNIDDLMYIGIDEVGNDSLREYMREQVMREMEEENKRRELKKKKDEEDEEQEDEDNEDEDYSNQSSSIINDNIPQKEITVNNISSNVKNLFNKPKVEDEYYKVNASKIKFMKYDYSKNILIEIKDYEKISQVEKRMHENKKNEGEDNNNNNQDNKNLNQNFSLNTNQNINNIIIGLDSNMVENPLIKEIEYALKKEESQESISLLNKMSVLVFIILMGMGSITLFYILTTSSKLKVIGNLITDSYRLLILNSVGIYYVKELILLNNENYTLIPSRSNREKYIETIYNHTMELFEESHKLISFTTSTNLKFSSKNYKIIYEDLIDTENIIFPDLTIKIVKTTMQSTFIEAITALFNIATKKINSVIPTEQDTFFYLNPTLIFNA